MPRAFVQVQSPDGYKYWNPIGPVRETQTEAEADIEAYRGHKREGTGDFRKGSPSQTKVE
jgi:hypothetical protein